MEALLNKYMYHKMDPNLLMQPEKQKFYRVCKKILSMHGMWPSVEIRGEVTRDLNGMRFGNFIFMLHAVMWLLTLHYLIEHFELSLYYKGHQITELCIIGVMLTRMISVRSKIYAEQISRYFNEIHVCNFPDHTPGTLEIAHKTEQRCHYLYVFLTICMVMGPVTFNITAIILNVLSGAFNDQTGTIALDSTQYLTMPFDYQYNKVNWTIMFIILGWTNFVFPGVIVFFDMYMLFTVIHMVGQMEIMVHTLKLIGEEVNDKNKLTYTPEENDRLNATLKRIIEHHNRILDFYELFDRAYGYVMVINYTYDTIACCILLLVLTDNWPYGVIRYGTLSAVVFSQLVGESFAMEQLSISIDELHEVIYTIPWYLMDMRAKRSVYIMVLVSQRGFVFTPCDVMTANLKAMATILKSTVSYFFWLKTMQ